MQIALASSRCLKASKSRQPLGCGLASEPHQNLQHVVEMLRGCKKLRFLVIELKNLQITKELLATITGILKENGVTPDKPLQFKVNVQKKVKNVKLKHLMAETPNAVNQINN
ncbi:uncharacterized protein LOC117579609 [Drosophila guanche]|uniref:Uncharacterized protein n=1 Tax=Drosophila guanche TaxID=7266 RepID=A0A3B0JAK0_DROGU|nr:uncharacterized protein LOC117579609 [Drosophila guanche]SPP77022.1 Hypothetical predicted protein [Drosophila guanche]